MADFMVIDRDVLAVPHDQLKDVRVLQTWVAGELIFENRKWKIGKQNPVFFPQ